MGDINIDSQVKGNDYMSLSEILTSYNIQRLELPPTRITPNTRTSIDCVCTNLQAENLQVEVINSAISDHTAQLCTANWISNLPPPPVPERRNMCTKNLHKLKSLLQQKDWTPVLNPNDVETSYNNFISTLSGAINLTCPIVKMKLKPKQKEQIFNDPIAMQMKREYIDAQNLYINTGNENDKRNAAMHKKQYDLRLKYLRRQNNISIIATADNKSKALWQVINAERKPKDKQTLPSVLDIDGELVSNPYRIAEHLNTFFTNIAEDIILNKNQQNDRKILPDANTSTNISNLTLQPTNLQEMDKLIQSLKTKTSAGYDCVSTKLLKICKEELTDPLINIINKSFASGVFPSALKLAKVYPKFKQGCTTQAANYRPISLIPTFSKLIEKLVLTRLLQHLSINELLTPQQHGFLAGRSTITALISLVEFLIDQMEEGNTSTAILLDYSKAFDCLNHEHLLVKLTTLGVQGQSYDWFKSYLTGRSQVVDITYTSNGLITTMTSKPQTLSRGVPQGSVLGPVLFILYTNDLPQYMQTFSQTLMFADDTVLLLGEKEPDELEIAAHIALNMAIQYCNGNDLVINENKTKQLVLRRQNDSLGALPNVEETTSSKYLGIIIDDHLSWTEHINSLCSKLSTGLYVIRRIKNTCDTATAKNAYFALYESHLRYGITVWGGTTMCNLQRLLINQKRAIRILKNLQPRDSCRQAFVELKILTVVCLYILETVTFLHLQTHEGARTGTQNHSYNTRHAFNYQLPVHRLTATEKKPTYAGAKLWNALPEELKKVNRLQFKHRLKNWLLEHPFYNLNEFYERINNDASTTL